MRISNMSLFRAVAIKRLTVFVKYIVNRNVFKDFKSQSLALMLFAFLTTSYWLCYTTTCITIGNKTNKKHFKLIQEKNEQTYKNCLNL